MIRWLFFIGILSIAGMANFSSEAQAQEPEVLTEVDREPRFKGNPSRPEKFLEKHLSYPEEARLKMIEGVVKISFVITDNGKLVEPSVEKGVDPLLDNEALRLVGMMDEWRPAKKDGEKIDAEMILPVTFELSQDTKKLMQTFSDKGLADEMPLFVIDDKIVNTYVEIPHYNVKSVRVMKGEKAIERYGEKARNGVVIIKTKRGTPPVR